MEMVFSKMGNLTVRCCAFTTCDDAYVAKSVVSLCIVRKWNPDIDLYIVGGSFSEASKDLCKNCNISVIEADFSNFFSSRSAYPVECFYWFHASKILADYGYEFALYIDADVYCNSNVIGVLTSTKGISGASGGSIRDVFKSDVDIIERHCGPIPDVQRIQTGVVFLNLSYVLQWKLDQKAAYAFNESLKIGAPRAGDDSLMAFLMFRNPDMQVEILDASCNFIERRRYHHESQAWSSVDSELFNSIKFFHFTAASEKPWTLSMRQPTSLAHFFARKWILSAIEILSELDLEVFFPTIAEKLTDRHLKFYWWPSQNVGDLITQYLIDRFSNGLKITSISEREIKRIERFGKWASLYYRLRKREMPARYIVSTGSVVRLCGRRALVFGSGIRSSNQEAKKAKVRFVRGPLTRDSFISAGSTVSCFYGDPGLLMPQFYRPAGEKKHRLAIIPHFTEFEEISRRYQHYDGVVVIDMGNGDLEGCIDLISASEATVSSSLHGLVFSHAYRVPTRHIMFSDNVFGDGTKFRDYYLSVGLSIRTLDLRGNFDFSPDALIASADESLGDFDSTRLSDEFFVDENGLKRSILYPF